MGNTLAIHVSNLCQNNCIFCMERTSSGDRITHRVHSPEEFSSIVRNAHNHIPDFTRVFIAGGEPTLNMDFIEIVQSISPEVRRVDVVTNGARFAEDGFSQAYANAGGQGVHLSIHSHDEYVHEELTGRKGSHQRSIKAGQNILKSGLKLYTNTVLTELNYRELPRTAKWISRTFPGMHMIVFYLVRPVGAADGNIRVLAPLSRITESIIETIETIERGSVNVLITVRDIPPCMIRGKEDYIRYQDFFVFQDGHYSRLSEGRYSKSLKCIFCRYRKTCRGMLSRYPSDRTFNER